jgi:hypothetical protein
MCFLAFVLEAAGTSKIGQHLLSGKRISGYDTLLYEQCYASPNAAEFGENYG